MAERRLILEAGAAGGSVAGRLTCESRAENAPRPFNFSRSGPYFAGLFLLALVAYWPTYFSRVLSADHYTHFHASLAAVWILMLAAQPMLIRSKRLAWHRLLGGFSYALAPLIVVSIVLLAHSRIKGLSGESYARPDLHPVSTGVTDRVVRPVLRPGDLQATSSRYTRAS